MYNSFSSTNLMEMAENCPNVILQVKMSDLHEFAQQLICNAADSARLQLKRADLTKELLTTDEVVSMLKVSKMTLWRWDKNELLTKISVGGVRRYRRSEVEALIVNRINNRKNIK
jgi:predicted DNA-binding transcriptional regulator AlpA